MINTQQYHRSAKVFSRNMWILALPLLICVGLVGCADREAIEQNRAALELAEMKGDLDAMYLALRQLDELGERDAQARLPGIKIAIESRERMLRAVADHDHEQALLAANEFLDQVPNDKDALETLRTSGHIFWYLQQATDELASFGLILEDPIVSVEEVAWSLPDDLDQESYQIELNKLAQQALEVLGRYSGEIDGKIGEQTRNALASFVQNEEIQHSGSIDADLVQALRVAARRKQLRDEQIDLSFANLTQAQENIARAKQLDPSFKQIIQLEEMTDGALAALVYLQGVQIIDSSETMVTAAAYIYQIIESAMSRTIGMRHMGPSDVWAATQPLVAQFRSEASGVLEEVALMNRRLAQSSGGAVEDFASAMNEYYIATKSAIEACTNPTGGLMDYRRDANAALQKYKESSDRLQQVLPSSKDIESSVKALAIALNGYSLYSDPAIEQIVIERVDDLTT